MRSQYKLIIKIFLCSLFLGFAVLSFPLSFTPAQAATTTYTLSSGYSSTQGQNNWYYYYKTYNPEGPPILATYGTAKMKPKDWFGAADNSFWNAGSSTWLMLAKNYVTGGDNEKGIIYWKAPAKGSATMTLTIRNIDSNRTRSNGFGVGIGYINAVGADFNSSSVSSYDQLLNMSKNDATQRTITTTRVMQGNDALFFLIDSYGQTYGDSASYAISIDFTPPPPTPTISSSPACTPTNTDSMYTISWASTSPVVSYVDISTDNFVSWYNKSVSGTSTTASSGFTGMSGTTVAGQSLIFQPNTTYYVRLWNGQLPHSNTISFTTPPACTNNAQYISQTCPPSTMSTGQTSAVAVTMKNTGSNNWTTGGNYKLGSQNPPDNNTWGLLGRISVESSVTSNTNKTFSFNATAPNTPGTYNFQWKMIQESVQWFGDTTPNCSVNVASPPTPTPTPTPVPATACGTGAARSTGLVSAPDVTNFNTTGACVKDALAAFAPYKLPSYDDLKSIYYTQSKATKTTVSPPPNPANQGTLRTALNSYNVVLINGNLDIGANLGGTLKTAVVFVEGDLNLNSTTFTFGDANSGLVFVVRGNVNISASVTQIDAVIISAGIIRTAGATCTPNSVPNANQLTINGSLISLSEGKPVQFCRQLADNNKAAEKIITQPKYLVILRDLFANTLQKWSEIQ